MNRVALIFPDEYLFAHNYFRPFLTETGDAVWGKTEFIINPSSGKFDAVIVIQSTSCLDRDYTLICPPTRTLLVLKEPPDILFLPEAYTKQFYCSLGQDKRVQSKLNIFSQSGHHWFAEVKIHDTEIASRPKTKLISAIVSNKTDTPGHRRRLIFMQKLSQYFGDQLDWFGRGVQDLGPRKLNGLQDYKYHIVLENGCWNDYWTEKLADAFVGNCFPLYWGAPNIHQYFDGDALKQIDIDDVDASIRVIETAIHQDLYKRSQDKIAHERHKIFNQYHPYATYLEILHQLPESKPFPITIKPHHSFKYSLGTRIKSKLKSYSSV
jgi:hypothetical protein